MTVKAENEDTFLNALSPITGFGANRHHRAYLYRGQSRPWPLVPASRRTDAGRLSTIAHLRVNSLLGRQVVEAEALMCFCDLADYQGLRIPGLPEVRNLVRREWEALAVANVDASARWPPEKLIPALALAQHNGLPTCLLDVSRNPFVAAYFAAREILTPESVQNADRSDADPSGDICVWIVADPRNTIHPDTPSRVRVVIPPASDNLTLQRQEGLFLYVPSDRQVMDERKREYSQDEPFEQVISNQTPASVIRLDLNKSCAKSLLHKVIKLGYDSSRFFPTFEGAVRCLAEYKSAGIPPTFFWAGGINH